MTGSATWHFGVLNRRREMYMLENVPMDALFPDRVPLGTAHEPVCGTLLSSAWACAAALGAAIGEAMSRALAGDGEDHDDDDPLPPSVIPPMM